MENFNGLEKRATVCYDRYGRAYRCNSTWSNWGRWVALAVIVIGAFLLFFLCSCFTARRRRKAGQKPFYGTGWVGRAPFGHGQAQYNPQYETQQPQQGNAPPNYNQAQGGYGNTNGGGAAQGYYGGGRDVEMQPPASTYQGGENVYTPPPGPPPNKR